jgi:hypothetical protein
MRTSKLNERQPVFGFLTPTDAQATTFRQPTEGTLNDPTPGRELGFAWHGAVLKDRFTAATAMFNVRHIAFLFDKLMDIRKVIAFIKTHMLLDLYGIRSRHNNRDNHFIDQPLVMGVRARNIDSQGSAAPIHENVDFTASLAAVHRTFAGIFASQRRWTRFAIDGLPRPLDTSALVIKLRELPHQTLKYATVLPFLKTVMDRRTTHAKPVLVDCFPLATCPQHIPDPIHHSSVIRSFSPWSFVFWLLWQEPSQPPPQRAWHSKIIDILWLLGMILVQDVSVLIGVSRLQSERDTSSFSTLSPIYG